VRIFGWNDGRSAHASETDESVKWTGKNVLPSRP
jgi:hypothetical protein